MPGATATPAGTGSNQTAAPTFVNAAGGDFHEAAGSPTIDAGITAPAIGTTDLDGNPRTIGRSTDVGAYEAAEAPTIVPAPPTGVLTNQATLHLSVNPNFSATTVQAYVGTSTSSENPLPAQSAGAGLSPVALAFSAVGLQPGAVYHYHFVVTNAIGTSSTGDQTFTTKSFTPKISGLSQSHRSWRAGNLLASFARKPRASLGTTFSFSLNEPARVRLVFVQPLSGRWVTGRCVAPGSTNRRRRACTRALNRGTLSFTGHVGLNMVSFQGRISPSRKLRTGHYTLIVTATNAATQSSIPKALSFTIVR
jgi:hypothetical protein